MTGTAAGSEALAVEYRTVGSLKPDPRNARTHPKRQLEHGITKLALLVAHLSAPGGATIAELCKATGWQPHSVRGGLAGALRRKGHVIRSEKEGGQRRYRIEEPVT